MSVTIELLQNEIASLEKQKSNLLAEANMAQGAILLATNLIKKMEADAADEAKTDSDSDTLPGPDTP